MRGVIERLRRLSPVRAGEAAPTFLCFSFLFLVIGSYIILKSVRDALYIDAYGAVKLPYVMIGIAIIVGLFVDLYIRLARRVPTPHLIVGTQLFFVSNLLLFWVLARAGAAWLFPVLYIWAGCFGVIAPVQFWTLANEVFSTREAKRLFGLIGAGGILGAVVGGAVTGVFADVLGSVDLLLVVAGVLLLCAAVVGFLARHRTEAGAAPSAPPRQRPASLRESGRQVARSPHLLVIAGLVGIGALCTTIIDWQFKAAAEQYVGGIVASDGAFRDQLASFFGTAYGAFSFASLFVQLVVVRLVFRRLGLGVAVLFLPIALLAGTGLTVALGGIVAATLMKGADGAFKHSIDRSSKELAYLPVSPALKVQVKSAIDMVLDRLGDGLGGVLLLVVATGLGLGIRSIGVINLILLTTWLLLAFRLRRSYLGELARSIRTGDLVQELPAASLNESDARYALRHALRSREESQVLAALELAALSPGPDLEPELRRLSRDGSSEVRAKALATLLRPSQESLPEGMTNELEEEDQDLLVKALDIVVADTDEEVRERAAALMGGGSADARGPMLALLIRRLGQEFEPVAGRIIDVLSAPEGPVDLRLAAATALGLLPADSALVPRLEHLLRDPDRPVRARAADSAGRLCSPSLAPALLPLLGHGATRGAARQALVACGDAAVPALLSALAAPGTERRVRERVPRVLAEIASSRAREALVQGLAAEDEALRDRCLDALVQIRRADPETPLGDRSRIDRVLRSEIAHLGSLVRLDEAVRAVRGGEASFLTVTLEETIARGRDRLCRLLELRYPPRQIMGIRRGLDARSRVQRDNSLELLESLLPRDLRERLVPLLERIASVPHERAAPAAEDRLPSIGEALAQLADDRDPWLAACALNVAARHRWPGVAEAARAASLGPGDETLRGEASQVLARVSGEAFVGDDERGPVTLVDKVIALRSVDAFRAVPTHELVHLGRIVRERRFAPGETLFAEGDPPGPLYFLLEGRVGLRRGTSPAGEAPAGSALGTWSLFDDEPRQLGAVALEDSRALVVEREDFYDVLSEQVGIVRSLMSDLARRLELPMV
jgi:AAA family ATP:ADP antiporter